METTELPWWKNRKFTVPLAGGIATIILTIAKAYWPELDLDSATFAQFLTGIWSAVLLIAGGDVGYDWLGLITDIVKALAEVRQQQPPAQG